MASGTGPGVRSLQGRLREIFCRPSTSCAGDIIIRARAQLITGKLVRVQTEAHF
jgi:hypothetical protein